MEECKHGIPINKVCWACTHPGKEAVSKSAATSPRVTIREIKLYNPKMDIAFHNELMDLLDRYLNEYRIDWNFE